MMSPTTSTRVWDLPTRLFHWLLVVLLGFSWWSAETDEMDWHRLSGSLLFGLIAFRLIWGFSGGSTARFGTFLRSPVNVVGYLRSIGPEPRSPGHNPVGGYSVAIMLLLVLMQIATGLFAVDVDGLESGQLSYLVSFDQGRIASEIHEISFTVLQIVAGIHILAILFYLLVRNRNLIFPMVTGRDSQIDDARAALIAAGPVRFIVALVISAALAWWTAAGFPV